MATDKERLDAAAAALAATNREASLSEKMVAVIRSQEQFVEGGDGVAVEALAVRVRILEGLVARVQALEDTPAVDPELVRATVKEEIAALPPTTSVGMVSAAIIALDDAGGDPVLAERQRANMAEVLALARLRLAASEEK